MINAKKSVSSSQMARDLVLNQISCWCIQRRIRAAMASEEYGLLRGIVEVDALAWSIDMSSVSRPRSCRRGILSSASVSMPMCVTMISSENACPIPSSQRECRGPK